MSDTVEKMGDGDGVMRQLSALAEFGMVVTDSDEKKPKGRELVKCELHGTMRGIRFCVKRASDGLFECAPKERCAGERQPYEACDLCNGPLNTSEGLEEHVEREHPFLLQFLDELEDEKKVLPHATIRPEAVRELGGSAREFAQQADGGPENWAIVTAAVEQLDIILRVAYPSARAFMFGSTVALSCWDGLGDLDCTLVDPKRWLTGDWPKNEEKVILNVARELRRVGFHYDDLEPVVRTRVPICKHKLYRKLRHTLSNPQSRQVRYTFHRPLRSNEAKMVFHEGEQVWHSNTEVTVKYATTTDALRNRIMTRTSINKAPVPSVEWEDRSCRPEVFHLDFDLSCRAHGVRNSLLLREYMMMSPYVRAGSVFVKAWSKTCGINNSMRGYLTSYAVSILWVFFLIRKKYVKQISPGSIPAEPQLQAFPYVQMLPSLEGRDDEEAFDDEMGRMILEFFRFYAFEFDYDAEVVSVNRTEVTTKQDLRWMPVLNETMAIKFRDRIWHRLCIEDPFEENLNLGRHVSPIKRRKIVAEFILAYQRLSSAGVGYLLVPRRAEGVAFNVCRTVRELMINRKSMPVTELWESLHQRHPSGLSVLQVEHSARHIIADAGFKVEDGQIRHASVAFIDEVSAKLLPKLDEKMKSIGVPLREVESLFPNVDHRGILSLFFVEDKRVFRNPSDAKEYFHTVRHINDHLRPLRDGAKISEVVRTASLEQWNCKPSAVDACCRDPSIFAQEGDDTVFSFDNARARNVAPPKINHDSGRRGRCDQCNAMVRVFTAVDTQCDDGAYCMDCWKEYGGVE